MYTKLELKTREKTISLPPNHVYKTLGVNISLMSARINLNKVLNVPVYILNQVGKP